MPFNEFLEQYGLFIALTIFSLIVILITLFLLLPRLKKEEPVKVTPRVSKDAFYALLGGEANVKEITLGGSRLSVRLNDQSLVDLEALKKHGVARVIVMETKLVLLVNEELKTLFNELR